MIRHYDPDGKHMFLDEIALKESREIPTFMFTNSMVLAKKMIAQGRGVGAYIRHGFIAELAEGSLKFIPIDHPSLSSHRLGIFIPANRFIDSIDRKFVDISEDVLTEYV
jgi:DNA-binding transcriptional LysR family regulator